MTVTLIRRINQLEQDVGPPPPPDGRDEDGSRYDWEERWDAAVADLTSTMAERHIQHVDETIAATIHLEDWYWKNWSNLTMTAVKMLERASGYFGIYHGPLSLPEAVADALLAYPDARLDCNAECRECGYQNPWRLVLPSPPLAEQLRLYPRVSGTILDRCGVCGGEVGLLRYRVMHNHTDPPEWHPAGSLPRETGS